MDVARDYGWDGKGPQSIDSLRQYWGKDNSTGSLFTQHASGLQFVGEAKGRLSNVIRPTAPHKDERIWLSKLDSWYSDFGLQYFLVLAMATTTEVVANVYDPGEPRTVYPPGSLNAAIESRESLLWERPIPGNCVSEAACFAANGGRS